MLGMLECIRRQGGTFINHARQQQRDDRAVARRLLHHDAATGIDHGARYQRETKSAAATDRFGGEEGFKHVQAGGFIESGTTITHSQGDRIVRLQADTDVDAAGADDSVARIAIRFNITRSRFTGTRRTQASVGPRSMDSVRSLGIMRCCVPSMRYMNSPRSSTCPPSCPSGDDSLINEGMPAPSCTFQKGLALLVSCPWRPTFSSQTFQ